MIAVPSTAERDRGLCLKDIVSFYLQRILFMTDTANSIFQETIKQI